MLKSRPDCFGSVAIAFHWVSALAVLAMLGTGFRAASAVDPGTQASLLRVHVPLGVAVLLLTLIRLGWWWLADRKPAPIAGTPAWQDAGARTVHALLYLALLLMTGSGIALMAASGAGDVLFAGDGVLPDFSAFAPRIAHGIGALVLVTVLAAHMGAALYHQFIRKNRIFRRMWFGRGGAVGR